MIQSGPLNCQVAHPGGKQRQEEPTEPVEASPNHNDLRKLPLLAPLADHKTLSRRFRSDIGALTIGPDTAR